MGRLAASEMEKWKAVHTNSAFYTTFLFQARPDDFVDILHAYVGILKLCHVFWPRATCIHVVITWAATTVGKKPFPDSTEMLKGGMYSTNGQNLE